MTARIIDGNALSAKLRGELAAKAAELTAQGTQPCLAVILVGGDPASAVYVRNKVAGCEKAGIKSLKFEYPQEAAPADVLARIAELNADPSVHGILVQLPLPKHLDEKPVIELIGPDKDVDGLHVVNAGRLVAGLPALVACTPTGCLMLAKATLGDLTGKHAVVVGRSLLVGKPVAQLLLAENCTVTMAHSRTVDLPSICRQADILVAAVGQPRMIRGDWIKPGACVIDVGINRVPFDDPEKAAQGKTKIVGDVNYKEALQVAGSITPVPKGVGPMTVAVLLHNTVLAAKRIAGVS
ncbi:bifunctional methylenetetrahydrofolate dehydrogenase/methenyltetrahydrofolate cyclohydrolase FolD [Accumulibacter sp.]|uniref:bifunctional methylenetetrahydrofolate dehydrogenase/methenyltetrahydrofolate cyclohydrolase FolD n=1 Tax=Accumulibacter sp. TaxID=2053492 RepID=UPI001ACAF02E|nr:bifunctional methylenetetrahydrofolate dehydrogenase/methenyltetrahydrofolate cyclohydrolase FolD [Accumulibacter sp.]MBN8455999.1 bifunctional methylenetetrahydrofolate dehydrogenase/methenyltetrahydrofolate cyclohydrolase FolD [Accumulibacter sp.]